MTNDQEEKPVDRLTGVFNRIISPQSEADRELMWTAIIAFALGALLFG